MLTSTERAACFLARGGLVSKWQRHKMHSALAEFKVTRDKHNLGIKIAGRNISNLRYAEDTTLMAESKEPLDESERGE